MAEVAVIYPGVSSISRSFNVPFMYNSTITLSFNDRFGALLEQYFHPELDDVCTSGISGADRHPRSADLINIREVVHSEYIGR